VRENAGFLATDNVHNYLAGGRYAPTVPAWSTFYSKHCLKIGHREAPAELPDRGFDLQSNTGEKLMV